MDYTLNVERVTWQGSAAGSKAADKQMREVAGMDGMHTIIIELMRPENFERVFNITFETAEGDSFPLSVVVSMMVFGGGFEPNQLEQNFTQHAQLAALSKVLAGEWN